MSDISKIEAHIKYKIKSSIIKNGWYIIYSILIPLFFALMFDIIWLLFISLCFAASPIYCMISDIKRLKKELREIRELSKEKDKQPIAEQNEGGDIV